MITVKITPFGGYVCGDGKLPEGLTPDDFYKAFATRIQKAALDGADLEITDEELEELKNKLCDKIEHAIDVTPVVEYEEFNQERILNNVEALVNIPVPV